MGVSKITPKLLCAQQASCQPMVQAWEENSPSIEQRHIVEHPTGIAKAILRGDPTKVYPYMKRIVDESGGLFASVTESEIKRARELVLEHEGVSICFSAATAMASVIKLAKNGSINAEERILVNLTGSDRVYENVPEDVVHWHKEQGEWVNSQEVLNA